MTMPLVYLIDDDLELTQVIERRFLKFGCDIRSFTTPELLMEAFTAEKPNLLLVDLNLADGLSGFDVIKKIRHEYKADLPILILSGVRDQKKIAHGLEIGATDYIVKPPLRHDFEEIISKYITAKNLPEPNIGTFQSINPSKKNSQLNFKVAIEEVHSGGLNLLSDHLINKGASFYLTGPELEKIAPGCQRLFVRVIGSATTILSDQKKYQIQVEIDGSQEGALEQIRDFLASKMVEQKAT